jgi:hypothetical protein
LSGVVEPLSATVLVDLLSDQTEQAGVDTEEEEEDDSLDVSRFPLLVTTGELDSHIRAFDQT